MSEMASQQTKRLSVSSDGLRTGVLERWSKAFEKGYVTKTPRTLPYRGSTEELENLELEDVCEEVQEEVDTKSGQRFANTKQNLTSLSKVTRRRSKELIRPKTPGRSGLYPEVSNVNGRPKWQSSTKIDQQSKIDPDKQPRITNYPKEQQLPSVTRSRQPPSSARSSKSDSSPVQCKPASSNNGPDVAEIKPVTSPPPAISIRSPTPVSPVLPVIPVLPVHPGTGGKPITQQIAIDLRNLVFGSALTSFNSDWRTQHINFLKHSSYGISFYKPGPCGVIACIQAFLMKYLLFCQQLSIMTESVLEPLPSERQQALVSAMADMLWQAGKESHCVIVALPGTETGKLPSKKDYRRDGLTENLVLFGFDDIKELEKFIKRHLSFFENTGGNGCVVFLYSVILSRTIKGVREDLGHPSSVLMGPNDTCSQAMINLLLTGRAVNHTFNGFMEYDRKGKALPFPLKGIKARSDVGFLTLNEHFRPREFQVGSMLKTPKYPVWVVDSTGGRYSVIFCLNSELVNDWRLERRFNLHYYNGTTKYSSSLDDIITIDTRDFVDESEITQDIHPVEHCLRTKWPGAVIEWN